MLWTKGEGKQSVASFNKLQLYHHHQQFNHHHHDHLTQQQHQHFKATQISLLPFFFSLNFFFLEMHTSISRRILHKVSTLLPFFSHLFFLFMLSFLSFNQIFIMGFFFSEMGFAFFFLEKLLLFVVVYMRKNKKTEITVVSLMNWSVILLSKLDC